MPTAPLVQEEIISVANGVEIHYLSLGPPSNIDRVDLDFYKVTAVDLNTTYTLSNSTLEYALPSLYSSGKRTAELIIVAVDRCRQTSVANTITRTYAANVNNIEDVYSCIIAMPSCTQILQRFEQGIPGIKW